MNIITLDFETYYDNDYTLSKLTTEEYVRDKRFEVLGCGVRWENGQFDWLDSDQIRPFLLEEEPTANECAILCHHAHFDGLILNHHYGIKPKYWLDTLSMARMVIGNHLPKSLDALATHFNLPQKTIPYDLFKGKHWVDLPSTTQQQIADGCLRDVELTYQIFQLLAKQFPKSEYQLVDTTVRMFTEPTLIGNTQLLAKIWLEERDKKHDLLAELGVTAGDLQSAERFAALLRAAGVEPEQKPGKNGSIYSFAKTDSFMRDLTYEDNYVQKLVHARLGVKSTLIQTRAARFGNMAVRGALPVYINYCGAHTTRWSGADKTNWQNLTRGNQLRDAISAPPGYLCAVADASQIECRLLNQFAGQHDIIQKFREGRDLYSELASAFYDRKVTRETPVERQVGKVLELASGYGSGPLVIQRILKRGEPSVALTDQQAQEACTLYRSTHLEVQRLWATAGRYLARLASPPLDNPKAKPLQWGCCEIREQRLYGPNGAWIDYSTLEFDQEINAWKFRKRNGWTKIWGGFLVENLIQFLARIHLGTVMKQLVKDGIPRIVLCTHDDIFALVRDDGDAEAWLQHMIALMSRSPEWMPDVPLAAEGGLGKTYGEAK